MSLTDNICMKRITSYWIGTVALILSALTASIQPLHASDMDSWKVIYSGAHTDNTVCYDPDIDRSEKEITCYGPSPKPDIFDSMTKIIGIMTLILSTIVIFFFTKAKFKKISRGKLYNDQIVNTFVGFSFLSIALLIAGFLDNMLGKL